MPIVGRNRKAKPRDVYDGLQSENFPMPRTGESFKSYLAKFVGHAAADPLLEMLIKMGYGEPSQREYLYRLECIAEEIRTLRFALDAKWKER